jgi:hypothetical protein
VSRDWDAWARQVERALDVANRKDTDFQDLFAPDAEFIDPTQTKTTDELPDVSRATARIFPDWTQQVTSIRGGDDWAAFEWIGRGTFKATKVEMEGVTLVEIDKQGLVTKWRDYFDMKGVEGQFRSAT